MRPTPSNLLFALTLLATPATAQAVWTTRPDGSAPPTGVKVESMPPGWHLTSGPASIIYRPADRAAGQYAVAARLHLFPGTGAHQEAFGLFIGGKDLAGGNQSYVYFLIRGDGAWIIKRRTGSSTSNVTSGWQSSPAILKAKPKDSVANQLRVEVGKDQVKFLINDREIWAGQRSAIPTDGIAGIRLNHNLSVHLDGFEIVPAKP